MFVGTFRTSSDPRADLGAPRDRAVVLDTKDKRAAVGIGERRHVLGDLVAHGLPVTMPDPFGALEQRLAVELLTLFRSDEVSQCVVVGHRHHRRLALRARTD